MAGLKITPCMARLKGELDIPMARCQGIINSETLATFRAYLNRVIGKKPRRFIIDFKDVTYINSSGIGELIRMSDGFEAAGGTFVLTHPSLEVMHLIKVLGLESLLPVLPDPRTAVRLFRKGNFKNATIALINQRLWERLETERRTHPIQPLPPLGNYTLVIVPESDFFTRFLERRLAGSKGKLKVAGDMAQARKTIGKSVPDLVIVDDAIAGIEDLVYDVKADRSTNRTRIIRMLRENPDPMRGFATRTVRVKEDGAIVEPFDYNELLALARREFQQYEQIRRVVSHGARFEILSTEQAIADVLNILPAFLDNSGMALDQIGTFLVAVKEAVDNAFRHGNGKDPKKLVRIDFRMDARKVMIAIEDQGQGFDYNFFIDQAKRMSAQESARERHRDDKTGGLGIIMMKRCTDKLEYSKPGNRVVLTKLLPLAPAVKK
ncbi:MAG: ATP-binding protein [Planctomycetota bacterium]